MARFDNLHWDLSSMVKNLIYDKLPENLIVHMEPRPMLEGQYLFELNSRYKMLATLIQKTAHVQLDPNLWLKFNDCPTPRLINVTQTRKLLKHDWGSHVMLAFDFYHQSESVTSTCNTANRSHTACKLNCLEIGIISNIGQPNLRFCNVESLVMPLIFFKSHSGKINLFRLIADSAKNEANPPMEKELLPSAAANHSSLNLKLEKIAKDADDPSITNCKFTFSIPAVTAMTTNHTHVEPSNESTGMDGGEAKKTVRKSKNAFRSAIKLAAKDLINSPPKAAGTGKSGATRNCGDSEKLQSEPTGGAFLILTQSQEPYRTTRPTFFKTCRQCPFHFLKSGGDIQRVAHRFPEELPD